MYIYNSVGVLCGFTVQRQSVAFVCWAALSHGVACTDDAHVHYLFTVFHEASLKMDTGTALMPCYFQIKTKAYVQTPISPPTGTEHLWTCQARSPKDLSQNQFDSALLLMTQPVERTVQKLWVLGKTANALKDSFRIQNSLDELKKHP